VVILRPQEVDDGAGGWTQETPLVVFSGTVDRIVPASRSQMEREEVDAGVQTEKRRMFLFVAPFPVLRVQDRMYLTPVTLEAAAEAGDTSLNLSDVTGLSAGTKLYLASGKPETVYVHPAYVAGSNPVAIVGTVKNAHALASGVAQEVWTVHYIYSEFTRTLQVEGLALE
jgi:hypothetical protein